MNHYPVLVLGIQIDQRYKRAPLVRADGAGLRYAGNFPARGQQHRIPQPVQRAVENQVAARAPSNPACRGSNRFRCSCWT